MTWQSDKGWSDRFVPHIKMWLADFILTPAPIEIDQQQATDLMVFVARDVRIACRIRRPRYIERYQNEFTIRCDRPSGKKTELDKIISGWGDYLFYGFADPTQTFLAYARLIDLKVFREEYSKHLRRRANGLPSHLAWGKAPNEDGSSEFLWFKVDVGFPDALIVQEWFARPPVPVTAQQNANPPRRVLTLFDADAAQTGA